MSGNGRFILQVAALLSAFVLSGCTRNVDAGKACAPELAKQTGFEIIGYQGFNADPVIGGIAWHTQRRIPDNGVIYEAGYTTWFGECQQYELKAVDAIKP
jgi:hypothetical protein